MKRKTGFELARELVSKAWPLKRGRLSEADLKAYRTQIGQIEYAYEEASMNTKRKTALNFLRSGATPEIVAQGTDLPLEEVLALSKALI